VSDKEDLEKKTPIIELTPTSLTLTPSSSLDTTDNHHERKPYSECSRQTKKVRMKECERLVGGDVVGLVGDLIAENPTVAKVYVARGDVIGDTDTRVFVPPSTFSTPQYDPIRAAIIMTRMGLSSRQYKNMRHYTGTMFPSYDAVHKAEQQLTPPVCVVTFGGISIAKVSLIQSIWFDIAHNPTILLMHRDNKTMPHIKIGGDSCTDISEKEGSSKSLLILAYAWVNDRNEQLSIWGSNSIFSHRAWCGEDITTVQSMCALFEHEITLLRNGLNFQSQNETWVSRFHVTMFGDMKRQN